MFFIKEEEEETNAVLNDFYICVLMGLVKKVSKLIPVLKSKWVALFPMLKILAEKIWCGNSSEINKEIESAIDV